MVTPNPPMQSSRTSSCTAESNSRRNESHGSGMLQASVTYHHRSFNSGDPSLHRSITTE
jgi:hypothetical protein